MRHTLLSLAFLAPAVALTGCADAPPPPPTKAEEPDDESGHDRDNMMTIHIFKRHAWLTARLSSKQGNALELFSERPLPHPTIKAEARRTDGKKFDLVFEMAPAVERPKDAAGQCTHYVAKAPWMTPDDDLTVVADIEVGGQVKKARWDEFIPKNFAHKKE
jgi:hypothetical protein